jgi:hypothetical protein
MPAASMTITAKTGPGVQVTATLITNVTSFNVDVIALMLTGVANGVPFQYSLSGVTTFTVAIAGTTYTLTIS